METKVKIQIKSVFGKVLFEYEKENNTIKDTLVEAVKGGANLRDANLYGANLGGANLYGANLLGADLRDAYLGGANLRGANLGGANLRGANLRGADLRGANLGDANLYGANLGGANLYGANLLGADLRDAYLGGANLRGANLGGANLGGANLYGANLLGAYLGGANLRGANLGGANLYGADLRDANLRGADLRGAKEVPYIPLSCPSDGAFIGWKKVHGKLVKLQIPEDARRCSATTQKCRCDKALVLAITDLDGSNPIEEIENTAQDHHVTYKVGELVLPDSFDEDRWNECSHGIHFFINKQDAINY